MAHIHTYTKRADGDKEGKSQRKGRLMWLVYTINHLDGRRHRVCKAKLGGDSGR